MSGLQEIKVPDIGDFADVDVIEVLVHPGDKVAQGQTLITLESDKATMEIPSPSEGVVRKLEVAVGDKVSHGSLIALLEASSAAGSSAPEPATARESVGATTPTPSRPASPVGQPVAAQTSPRAPAEHPPSPPLRALPRLPYASPSVRALARELGVALEQLAGTGKRGRITHDDIRALVKRVMAESGQGAGAPGGALAGLLPWPQVDFARFGPIERRKLSRIRRISGANLHRNWVTIPHVTNHEEADVTELEAFRTKVNRENAESDVKVTMLALLIKACVAALKKHPAFNASLDGEQIVLKRYYHLGFAADTPDGLLVPVVRDADQKGIVEIARETAELAAKARQGKLTPGDMSGGSFTISSLGGIGGTYFTPIINAPEVAILGVGRSTTRLVWNGQASEPRLILPLSLSWDHRVIDGAAAGRFNAYLARVLGDLRRTAL